MRTGETTDEKQNRSGEVRGRENITYKGVLRPADLTHSLYT